MKPPISAFEHGKRIVAVLLGLAVVFCLYALMFTEEYSKENLIALCAPCHLKADAKYHAERRKRRATQCG